MPHLTNEMDHSYIDEQELVERYRTGRLPPAESARFEEHFLECARCQEQLETAEDFRRSLVDFASDAVAIRRPDRGGLFGRLAPLLSPRFLALAAVLLVGLSASLTLLLGELGLTRRELASAKEASAESRRNEGEIRAALEHEQLMRGELDQKLRALPATAVGAAVFTLNLTRGAGEGAPENRIVLPGSPEWLVLVVDRPGPASLRRYRVRLSRADRRPVGDVLAPSPISSDQLAVAIPPGRVGPGDFMLAVDGLLPDGRSEPLATYTFRAVRKP